MTRKPEKSKNVDQKKRLAVLAFLDAHRTLLARQGTIVASYRSYRGRRLGPYYRLAFRDAGKPRSFYLGSDPGVVAVARESLQRVQAAGRGDRHTRQLRRALRAGLRRSKRAMAGELGELGLRMRGFEIYGWRQLAPRRLAPAAELPRRGICQRTQ